MVDGKDDDLQPASIFVWESGSGITKQTNFRVTPGWLPAPAAEWLGSLVERSVKDPRKEALRRARDTLRAHNLPVFNPMFLSDPICYEKDDVERCRPLDSAARVDVGQKIIRRYGKSLLAWTLPRDSAEVLVSLNDYVIQVRGFAADSPAGFAARIVCAYLDWFWARNFGDIDRVSDTAHDLSAVILMEQMKREWDAPAMQGKKAVSILAGGRKEGVAKIKSRAQAAHAAILRLDAKICRNHRELEIDIRTRARLIQRRTWKNEEKNLRYSLDYIADILKKNTK